MNTPKFKQARLRVPGRNKRQARIQFGALCWRMSEGAMEVLLITSRGRGRWIIPRGWPVDGQTPCEAAAAEAWEEAGALGQAGHDCIGIYAYHKPGDGGRARTPHVVAVFPFEVSGLSDSFPEQGQRRRKWVSPARAAKLVADKELAQIILHFAPGMPAAVALPDVGEVTDHRIAPA